LKPSFWGIDPLTPGDSGADVEGQLRLANPRGRTALGQRIRLAAALVALLCVGPSVAADPVPVQDDAVRRVVEILGQIRSRYVEPIDERKMVSDAVNGVLKGLDPYSKYLDPDAFKKMQAENRGRYGGLGMELRIEKGLPTVVAAYEDTPARRAGVMPGDRISRIDDNSTEGLTLEQVIQRMRGEPDSRVSLAVLREGEPEPRVLTLIRAVIQWQSVRSKLIEHDYGYLKLTHFQEQTPQMMAGAIEQLWKQGDHGLTGIVLDLRDNPGGLITAAVGVSAAFLPNDAPVVFADGAGENSKMRRYAKREDYLRGRAEDYLARLPAEVKSVPLVVLVNRNSASASEIVAGALQDHKRATILGTQTYGKGSIQQIIPFDDGSGLKITTSYYYTPAGHKVNGKGITPDVVVEAQGAAANKLTDAMPALPEADAQLTKAEAKAAAKCGQLVRTAAGEGGDGEQEVDCQLEEALHLLRERTAHKS
jgi:carboxyl-terminal processing protease